MRGFGITKLMLSKSIFTGVIKSSPCRSLHTSTKASKDLSQLFVGEGQSEFYAKYRPTYSPQMFEKIIQFYREKLNDFNLALDIACGSGQGTLPLASYFDKVVGLDTSKEQLKHAPKEVANLSYHVTPAEDLSTFDGRSVDLITVGASLHWFNSDRFFKEVTRVLKPGGSFVAYGYGRAIVSNIALQAYLNQTYSILISQWPQEFMSTEKHYWDISLPFPHWRRDDSVFLKKSWSIAELTGFLESFFTKDYFEKTPEGNPIGDFEGRLTSLYDDAGKGGGQKMDLAFPVYILMGHKPETAK